MKLKELILSQISELEIFEKYLGVKVKLGKAMKSPLRDEKHPSFNIYQNEHGHVYYKDFGDERGDCFKFVMEIHGCSFKESLELIAQDFGINNSDQDLSRIRRIASRIRIPKIYINPRKEFPYARTEWDELQLDLWSKANITTDVLQEYNTWPVSKVKIPKRDGGSFTLYSKNQDPIYCFDYENGVKKFYRPNAPDKKYKFISNLRKGDIFGLKQLRNHVQKTGTKEELVIICAGQKDCLSLYSNTGIRVIALNSESAALTKELYIELMGYTEQLAVCYDNDETGYKNATKIREEYSIPWINLGKIVHPDEVNDLYDFFAKKKSTEQLLRLIDSNVNRNRNNLH